MKDYSIVIPAHNESENIEAFVSKFINQLLSTVDDVRFEVILVENGSTDGTLDACERLQNKFPDIVKVFTNLHGSYGEAIKRGMLESCCSHLSILECDLLDVSFVVRSIKLFREGKTRFIVASKRHPESVDRRPFKRQMLTILYNMILKISFGYPGSDTHGLKSIETELAKELCKFAMTTDEIFQTELVLLAWRRGVDIKELPIRITERRPMTVSIRRRFSMVLDTIRSIRSSLDRFPTPPVTR